MTSSTLPLHLPEGGGGGWAGLYTSKLWALVLECAIGVDSLGPIENSGGEGATCSWCCLWL